MKNSNYSAVNLLQQYITIETTNPPCDVSGAIQFFSEICRSYGIPFHIEGPSPNRQNFIARIQGKGLKKPVILANHMDVVPANAEEWSFPPFGGIIDGGFLYGRGTIDMKCVGIFQLMAMLNLKRKGIKPDRDFYLVCTCDEETGGADGARWLSEKLPELSDADTMLNEGWPIIKNRLDQIDHICIDISEKRMVQVDLIARGRPGHASLPLPDNCNERIARAVNRILNYQPDPIVTPTVDRYFKALAPAQDEKTAEKFENLASALKDPEFREEFYRTPRNMAMTGNTRSLTILKGGVKSNVIPSESRATFDFRCLPGTGTDQLTEELRKIIKDPAIELIVEREGLNTGESSSESETYRLMEEVYREEFPGIPVTPNMVTYATDCRFFRAKSIDCYGFEPVVLTPEEISLMHGIDERISIENIERGTRLTVNLVEKLAGFQGA